MHTIWQYRELHRNKPVKWLTWLIAGWVVSCAQPVMAMVCDKDSLQEKSENGSVIITLSGHIYKVLGGEIDVALWLPAEDILVCQTSVPYNGKSYDIYEIYNLDQRGERADARLLK